jgi:hypothetical protein
MVYIEYKISNPCYCQTSHLQYKLFWLMTNYVQNVSYTIGSQRVLTFLFLIPYSLPLVLVKAGFEPSNLGSWVDCFTTVLLPTSHIFFLCYWHCMQIQINLSHEKLAWVKRSNLLVKCIIDKEKSQGDISKLECFPGKIFFRLVEYFWVRLEPTWVKCLTSNPLQATGITNKY